MMFSLACVFLVFDMMMQISPGVLATHLMHDLKLNSTSLGIVSGFYYWSYTSLQLPSGLLYDRYPKHKIIASAFLTCAVGTAIFAIATSPTTAIVGRLLMGAGSAFAFVGVLVVGASVYPQRYFNVVAGITQFVGAIGAILAQSPLLAASQHIGWRTALLCISAFGIAASYAILRTLQLPQEKTHQHKSDNLAQHIKYVCSQPKSWIIAVIACFCWGPMLGFSSLWGIPFLVSTQHISSRVAAHLIELSWLSVAVFAVLQGLWADRIKQQRRPMLFFIAIGIASLACVNYGKQLPYSLLSACMIGLGAACTSATLTFPWVKSIYPKHYQATALGFNNTWLVVSGLIFQPLMGWIINSHHTTQTTLLHYTPSDYRHGLTALLMSFSIALLVCWLTKPPHQAALIEATTY